MPVTQGEYVDLALLLHESAAPAHWMSVDHVTLAYRQSDFSIWIYLLFLLGCLISKIDPLLTPQWMNR